MKTITRPALIEMIRNVKGNTFATLVCDTDPRLKKTGNPYGNVRKVSVLNVCIGFDYSNSVNNQRSREAIESEFLVAPRKWGTRIDLKTVEHKGNTYLTTKVEKCQDVKYVCGGLELQKSNIEAFLPAKRKSTRQGTDKEIIYRDINIENVKTITMKGDTFQIV